jgi:light-regulated signal transduction histidine kinase (bacteriophytochrome)
MVNSGEAMPPQETDTIDDDRSRAVTPSVPDELQLQSAGFLIQMSLDWIILRASENVDDFLGESHVTLIEEPLSRFVQAQALHDLRNLFSRLSGSTGIGRAYRVRLTDDRPRFDITFQVSEGRVLLEAAPSPERGPGKAMGSVGGLIESLGGRSGPALMEGAARRLRALTGYDQCSIVCGDRTAHSSRAISSDTADLADLPGIIADTAEAPVPIFPRRAGDDSISRALLRSPRTELLQQMRDHGIRSALSVPITFEGQASGHIRCESRSPQSPNIELHAAAELFAQMLALRLEVDRLRA